VSILSPFTGLLRSALGVAEHEETQAAAHSPLHSTIAAEEEVEHLVRALCSAAESADRQVEVLDGVARSLPALTDKVAALTEQVTAMNDQSVDLNRQLRELVKLLGPVAHAERDASRIERLFRRGRRHADEPPGDHAQTG
jgi:hypothetical protein